VRLVERLFQRRPDLRLISATTGVEGIDAAKVHLPALVLLEMRLPDVDGATLLRCLRNSPTTVTIPVIVLSADAIDRHIQQALELGASAYVTKPYDGQRLLRLIDEIIRGSASVAVVLEGYPSACRQARDLARQWCSDRAVSMDVVARVELVVDELVTNAVRHAAPPYEVRLRVTDRHLRGEVIDASITPPRVNTHPDHRGGFGLQIVTACATRWGTEPTLSGKYVWFEIDKTQDR
jgi:DNA-binding response OmpR family regulator